MEAAFVDGRRGRLLSVRTVPAAAPRALVLFVHPFAEENAKSRHVVRAASRALAARGVAVCTLDLYGCGDSDGSLADADFEEWAGDVAELASELERAQGLACHFWGLRAGALTAAAALRLLDREQRTLILWQPAMRGKQVISEFLRIRTASVMLSSGVRESVDGLRAALAREGVVEIAGYPLGARIAAGIDAAELAGALPGATRVLWFDVSAAPERGLAPAARRLEEAWRSQGHRVDVQRIAGPAFWSSGELQSCPQLVQATAETVAAALT